MTTKTPTPEDLDSVAAYLEMKAAQTAEYVAYCTDNDFVSGGLSMAGLQSSASTLREVSARLRMPITECVVKDAGSAIRKLWPK